MNTFLSYNFWISFVRLSHQKYILMWFPMSSKYLKSLEVFEYVIVWSSKKDWCKNNWRFDIDTVSKLHKLVLTVCKLISSITIRWNDIAKKQFSIRLHSQDLIKRYKFALSFFETEDMSTNIRIHIVDNILEVLSIQILYKLIYWSSSD